MLKKTLFALVFVLTITSQAFCTHLKGGKISIASVGILGEYRITIDAYLKTKAAGAQALFSNGNSGILDFGDGSSIHLDEQAGIIDLQLSPDHSTAVVKFEVTHVYPLSGKYYVTYTEPNRDEGIINMSNSVNTPFFLQSFIVVDANLESNATPIIIAPPILTAVVGKDFSVSMAAYIEADNLLYYSMVTPKSSNDKLVDGYTLPENFKINSKTGLITWDGKFNNNPVVGEFAFTVQVKQIKDNSVISYVNFDFQIIVADELLTPSSADNENLTNARIFVPANAERTVRAFVEVPKDVDVALAYYPSIVEIQKNLFSFESKDSLSEDNRLYKVGLLRVKPLEQVIRNNPYPAVIRASFIKDQISWPKDLTYLFFTKDVVLEEPNLVTAITNKEGSSVRVYPNPVSENIAIETINQTPSSVQLLDLNGYVVLEKQFVNNTSLNVQHLAQGLYLVKVVTSNSKQHSLRILKK